MGVVVAVVVVAAVVGYLFAGWRLAVADLRYARVRAARAWLAPENIRTSVKYQTVCMVFLWPVLLPVRVVSWRVDRAIDDRDPVVLAARLAERDRRVAELERELGIGRDAT